MREFSLRLSFLVLLTTVAVKVSFSQQFQTKLSGWNAYVHLPGDYDQNPTKYYPLIVFVPGLGEVGTDPSLLLVYGPNKFVADGNPMEFMVNGVLEKPILISIQPPNAWSPATGMKPVLDQIIQTWRVDTNRINLTGLSMGGWEVEGFVSFYDINWTKEIASIVSMSRVEPGNAGYDTLKTFALNGGKIWGFEGTLDQRYMARARDVVNRVVPGAYRYYQYDGGHCCWNTWYDPNWKDPSDGESIYTWMLKQRRGGVTSTVNQPPVVNAGKDTTITAPANSINLSGFASDPDGSISKILWSQDSGPNTAIIQSPNSLNTDIRNLVAGTYVFSLKATDNLGLASSATMKVSLTATQDSLPVANAGSDQIITLPLDSVQLSGSGTTSSGSITKYAWYQVSGPSSAYILNDSSATTWVQNLIAGQYTFAFIVTNDAGLKDTSTVKVTVNNASAPAVSINGGNNLNISVDSTTLTGVASPSNGLTITSYLWEEVSGGTATIVTPSDSATHLTGLSNGTYTFKLTVKQSDGQTASSTINLTVTLGFTGTTTDCGCTWVFDPATSDSSLYWVNNGRIKAGDVICLKTGRFNHVSFDGLIGAPGNPITIKNCGGPVIIGSDFTYMFRVMNSKYLHITGTGDPNTFYGIKTQPFFTNLTSAAYSFNGVLSDIEIDHVWGDSTRVWGIQLKTTPVDYDSLTWHPYGVINNIKIHDCKMSNTGVEGYYIGYTDYDVPVKTASGTTINVDAPRIVNLEFHDNISLNTGWDGMQFAAVDNFVAYNNYIHNYGMTNTSGQMDGFILGGRTWGRMYNNYIDSGGSTGIHLMGFNQNAPPTLIYNNLVINAGWDGIWTDDRPGSNDRYPNQKYYIFNNTIVNPARYGANFYSSNGTVSSGNRFQNNLIVNPANNFINEDKTMAVPGMIDTTHNFGIKSLASAGFIPGTWKLSPFSPAYNITGVDASAFFTTDYDYMNRNGVYDMGAYINAPDTITVLTAYAGQDIQIMLPKNSITLTGVGIDPDGDTLTYQWTQISGPSSATIVTPGVASTDINNLIAGVYNFQFQVSNSKGQSALDSVLVTVITPPNQPPVAYAGTDKSITLPASSVNLAGSGTDPDGKVVSFFWAKISGPSSFNIVSPNSAATTVNGLVEGVYQFQLTVTDDKGATGTDIVQVTVKSVPNKAPTANAGSNQVITLPVNTVTLNGSGNDSDGTIASYLWTKVSGPSSFNIVNPNSAKTDVNGLVSGIYQFQLTVTDDKGATGTAFVQVTVNVAPNKIPTANAGADQTITLPLDSVYLKGSGNDSDGTIVSYKWTKINGPSSFIIINSASSGTGVTGLVQGVYEFELTVTDDKGATATDNVKITVNAAQNQTPQANAGPDMTITLPTSQVSLKGSGTDPDGQVVSYLWSKISGPSSFTIVSPSNPATDVTGLVQGVYTFQLKVTDDKGASSTDIMKVTVQAAPNNAPVANAGPDQTITLPVNTISLVGSGSDSDGSIVSYQWIKTSGPNTFNIVNSTSPVTDVTGLVEGIYQFQLTIKDNLGATATDIVQITVKAAPNKAPVANAGPDITISMPVNSVSLSGSGSDADGKIVSYQWIKISGPSSYNIVNPASPKTDVTGLVAGVYQFQLKVTDDKGATGADNVNVTVNASSNDLPVANAGPDRSVILPADNIILDGSSSDAGGTITKYLWSQVSGPSSAAISSPGNSSTQVSNLVAGTYLFEFAVTDNRGAIGKDTMQLTVLAGRESTTTTLEYSFNVYPNPVISRATVEITDAKTNERLLMVITDAQGRIIQQEEIYMGGVSVIRHQIDLTGKAKGVYIVALMVNGQVRASRQIIKL